MGPGWKLKALRANAKTGTELLARCKRTPHTEQRMAKTDSYNSFKIYTLTEGCIFHKVYLLRVPAQLSVKLTGDEATGSRLQLTSS